MFREERKAEAQLCRLGHRGRDRDENGYQNRDKKKGDGQEENGYHLLITYSVQDVLPGAVKDTEMIMSQPNSSRN